MVPFLCHSGKGKAMTDGGQISGCWGLRMEKRLFTKQKRIFFFFLSDATALCPNYVSGYMTQCIWQNSDNSNQRHELYHL